MNFQEVREFLKNNYIHDRFVNSNGFNHDREERITKSVIDNLEKYGEDRITHHSSKTFTAIKFNKNLEIISQEKGQKFNLSHLL